MTIINLQLIVGLACSIHIILIHLQRKKLQRKLLIFLQNRFFFVRRNNLSLYISFEQLAMFAPWQSHKSLRNYKLGSINDPYWFDLAHEAIRNRELAVFIRLTMRRLLNFSWFECSVYTRAVFI